MAMLGLGTYRCRDVTAAAQAAIAAGAAVIDTAPVYSHGTAQSQLAPLLHDHPEVRVSTKSGHMTRGQAKAARQAGAITDVEAARGHCITPEYLDHQLDANSAELRREHIDLLYLHNPEHDIHHDRNRLLDQITRAFTACEQAAHDGKIRGYGIATWSGFTSGAFSVKDLIDAAHTAAGGPTTHLQAIQLPISLVQLTPITQALSGSGPLTQATRAGLEVWASAPLNGGELADMVTDELATLISPGLSPVQAALAIVGSAPGLSGALLSASTAAHWHEALAAFNQPPIPPAHLRKICHVLRAR